MQDLRYNQNAGDCKTMKEGAKIWVPNKKLEDGMMEQQALLVFEKEHTKRKETVKSKLKSIHVLRTMKKVMNPNGTAKRCRYKILAV